MDLVNGVARGAGLDAGAAQGWGAQGWANGWMAAPALRPLPIILIVGYD